MDVRTIDLETGPDPNIEFRLQSDDCVVSIWLPASVRPLGRAMRALREAGFVEATREATRE